MAEEIIVDMPKEVHQVEVMMIGDIGIEENSRLLTILPLVFSIYPIKLQTSNHL
jgi:hypothetical protein